MNAWEREGEFLKAWMNNLISIRYLEKQRLKTNYRVISSLLYNAKKNYSVKV